jgi:hypothetical protein
MMMHLWEAKHPYYCNEGNYFSNDDSLASHFKSWKDFLIEEGDSDMDYNLIFRFDWSEIDDNDDFTFNGDVNYRNGILKLFYMGQRKGLYRWVTVEVCRSDEPDVITFLQSRWEHMRRLWEPLSTSTFVAT